MIVSKTNGTGKKLKTSIYAAGATLARQTIAYDTNGNPTIQDIEFDQWDASGMSYRRTYGNVINTFDGVSEKGETDPTGSGVGLDGLAYFEANLPPERDYLLRQPSGFEDVAVHQNGAEIACYEDGVLTSCGRAYRNLENGSAIPKVHLRQERDPRRKQKPPPAVEFDTYGGGRISFGYYANAADGTRIDPLTKEEILVVNTGFVQFSFIVPGLWDARSQPRTQDEKYTQEKKDCDKKLSGIFGGEDASAAGSGFEPENLFGKNVSTGKSRAGGFRGNEFGHLNNALHLYYGDDTGKNAGEFEGDVFIPEGGEYVGPNPLVSGEASYLFFYKKLGNLTNVFLTTSHINEFIKPNGITKGKTKIGQIGGEGGNSLDKKNEAIAGKYLHSHFTIFNGTYNYNKKKRRKVASIRNERNSFFNTFCK